MLKMRLKWPLKEERENETYLRRVLRSARKRERPERWPDERERRREREGFDLKKENGEETRGRRRQKRGWVLPFKTASFHLSETTSFSHSNDWPFASTDDMSFDHTTKRPRV